MPTKTVRILGTVLVAVLVTGGGYGSLVVLGDVPAAQFDGESGRSLATSLVGGAMFGFGYFAWGHESLYGRESDAD